MMPQERSQANPNGDTEWDIVYFPLGAAAFGGAERSLLELAAAQQKKGKRVLVCYESALENTDFIAKASARNLAVKHVDWAPEQSLLDVTRAAWQFFRRLNAKLIHFNMSWRRHMWLIPLLARLLSNARLIGSIRAIPERYDEIPRGRHFGFIPGLRLWILPDLISGRIWGRTLHTSVSVNRDDFPPRLVHEFGFPPNRLKVIYNGVPIPDRMPEPKERLAAKLKLGFSPQTFLATYVGRISEEKGIQFAIEAMKSTHPLVQLLIVGEGEQLDELKMQVANSGLATRVHFIGYVSDPFSIFSAADATVVPSVWREAFGRVVVEAMACGSVVIATAVGGMRELFTDGEEGIYVEKADAAGIASAIMRLSADRDYWATLSLAGRTLAETRYSTTRVAEEYTQAYSHILNHH